MNDREFMLYDDRNLNCKPDIYKLRFCNSFMITTAIGYFCFYVCNGFRIHQILLRFPRESTQILSVDVFLEFSYKDIAADTMIWCPCENMIKLVFSCLYVYLLLSDAVQNQENKCSEYQCTTWGNKFCYTQGMFPLAYTICSKYTSPIFMYLQVLLLQILQC